MSLTLTEDDLTLTDPARAKMAELCAQADESVAGVRVYATGGCSGIGFGMTFTDAIYEEDAVREFAEEAGDKLGKVAQPLRAALTGRAVSPGVFDVLAVLGREESLARLRDVT